MKKSLSAILSLAMAFSMFSSVALAAEGDAPKTSADFTDLKDLDAATKAKFDAMISAGVFNGVAEGTFGLNDNMNRAQFAKVAALIFGLEVDETLKTSSFSDVSAADPANGYAVPYIEAIVKAGITNGVGGNKFDPAGNVTKEQLAAFLVRGLGLDAQAKTTPGINDATVSPWARGYVALAIEKGIMTAGTGGFGGTTPATRSLLVVSAYEAQQDVVPDSIQVKGAKATNYNEVTVEFNGPVSGDVAVAVKKGTSELDVESTTLSADKRSAVVVLDNKISAGEYSVTVSGVTGLEADKATASFTGEDEKITKIEFLNASEDIAKAAKDGEKAQVRVEFQALNQYGKASSLKTSDFSINVSGNDVESKTITGETAIDLFVDGAADINDRVVITIFNYSAGVSASKTFKISDIQRVAKIEFGNLKNSSGEEISYVRAGEEAYLNFKAYDQFGYQITGEDILNDGVNLFSTSDKITFGEEVSGERDDDNPFVSDVDNDDKADLLIFAEEDATGKFTVNAFTSGSTVTKEIEVAAIKVPATFELVNTAGTLAEGDVNKYISIKAKDSQGNELTAQDIADAQDLNGEETLVVYGTGPFGSVDEIITSGEHRGKVLIPEVSNKGQGMIVAYLKDNPTVESRLNLTAQAEREIESIKFKEDVPALIQNGVDNEGEFEIALYDQYNEEVKEEDGAFGEFVENYKVQIDIKGDLRLNIPGGEEVTEEEDESVTGTVYRYVIDGAEEDGAPGFDIFEDEIVVSDTGAKGNHTITFSLIDKDPENDENPLVDDYKKTVRVFDMDEESVTDQFRYAVSLKEVKDSTLFGAADAEAIPGDDAAADYWNSALAKKVELKVTNSSGKEVITNLQITSVFSSQSQIAATSKQGTEWQVVGVDDGEATITVNYNTADGNEVKTIPVKVNTARPVVTAVEGELNEDYNVARADLDASTVDVFNIIKDLEVTDNYGTVYEGKTDIVKFRELLNANFYIKDIETATGNRVQMTVDSATGLIDVAANNAASAQVTSFKLVGNFGGKELEIDVVLD